MYDPRNPCDISYDILLMDINDLVDVSYEMYFLKEKSGFSIRVLGACEDLSVKDSYAYLERRIGNDISYGAYL